MKTFACLFAILLFISLAYAQPCPGNLVNDPNFAGGSYYCRATADEIANDDIELCTIGYNGTDLSAILGVPDQTNLTTQLAPGGWVPTGPVDVITPNYQPTNGLWAIKLNGQFGAGGVAQNISIPLANSACTLLLNDATNEHAPLGFSSSYQVIVQLVGSATPAYNATRHAPPVPNPASQTTLTRENVTLVLGAAGTYTLSFISNDRTPVNFTDGLYTTQTYYGRTGAVIDNVCLTCLASPSPSITPSVTPTSSISISSTPSISISATSSISLSGSVSLSLTPSITATATRSLSSSNSVSLTSSPSISLSGSVSLSLTPSVTATSSKSLSSSNSISLTSSPSISLSATSSISISATPSATVSPSLTATPSISISATSSISISATPSASFSPSASPSASPPPPPSCPGLYSNDDDDAWRNFYASQNRDHHNEDQTVINLYFADILNRGSEDDDQGWENVPAPSCSQNY